MRRDSSEMRFRSWIMALGLPLLILPIITFLAVGSATAGPSHELFGTTESRNNSLRPFPKWTGVLERYFRTAGTKEGSCTAKTFNKCHAQRWQDLVDQLRGQDLTSQLQAVNGFMNKTRYIVDPINWGLKDYWATPGQFFAKFGDCEDYAIAKYLTLKRLGVAPGIMRIVVLQDMNLRVAHAVLAVYTDSGIVILDNQIRQAVLSSVIRHYKPIFSINEEAWWLHRGRRRANRG